MKKVLIILIGIECIILGLLCFNLFGQKKVNLPKEVFENINIIELSDSKIKSNFSKEEYYVEDNYERYLKYKEENNVDIKEAIRCVNANIDYKFYTNIVNTDLSKGILILVNKYNRLSSSYSPDLVTMESNYSRDGQRMEKEAYSHFKEMVDAAKKDGIKIYNISAYRSYSSQNSLYTMYSNRDGVTKADTYSARPGHSEHQTGYATDIICASSGCKFEEKKEYEWLKDNSYKYGFIIRYPKGKEYITGYTFEPWHYRYVGLDVAKYIYEHDITFDEYYEVFIKNKI